MTRLARQRQPDGQRTPTEDRPPTATQQQRPPNRANNNALVCCALLSGHQTAKQSTQTTPQPHTRQEHVKRKKTAFPAVQVADTKQDARQAPRKDKDTMKAYEFRLNDGNNNETATQIYIMADTKKEAVKAFATGHGLTQRKAAEMFKQEEPKQEAGGLEPDTDDPSPVGVVEPQEQPQEQQEQPQGAPKLVTIDGDIMTVTYFIRSQKMDEKNILHGTVTQATRKLSIPKPFNGTGAEVERFIISDMFAAIDADKNRANRALSSEKATEEEQEEAKEAIRILDEQTKILTNIRTKAGYPADAPTVADYPLSRILACVVTRTALPVEYSTAKKALKAVCDVYRVILYENRALTDKEQETVTAVKTALHDVLKPFTAEAKDSRGFNLRIKNTDVVDFFLCSWKMEEDGKLTCTADKKRGTLERNLFKVAFGKILHLEETETK